MKSYLDLLSHILENGEKREDRTNVGTISSFGHQLKFDLRDGFPAVTTKKLAWKGVVSELIWFLEGSDDERRLAEIRYNKNRDELTDIDDLLNALEKKTTPGIMKLTPSKIKQYKNALKHIRSK